MKRTLLDMTQEILASLNSDEVNSISDTTESLQVAGVIRTTYFNMMARYSLPENNQLVQLDASVDADKPVLMLRPSGVNRVHWVQYYEDNSADDTVSMFRDVKILSLKDFLNIVDGFDTDEDEVEEFTLSVVNQNNEIASNFTFKYMNDRGPTYCTVIQDKYFVFDSYDAEVDSTLQSSKTRCLGWISPQFDMDDNFIPELDDNQFPLLLNEAKSLAFFELKQMVHPKAEQETRRQISFLQKYKSVTGKPTDFDQLPNFGRY